MWPMLLDMTRDECKRILRRLELEAYGSVVSALRAQGDLTKEKRKLLQDLASSLSISMERHRAEIRRAVNDEKLATIADHMAGPNTSSEWAIEGRRLIPLMPRLVPQTAFTALANNVANMAAAENAKMPPPANTARKNVATEDTPVRENPVVPDTKRNTVSPTKTPQRPSSPSSNVVVLPSGMSIHIKREEGEDDRGRKRRRSSSVGVVTPSSIVKPPSPAPLPPKIPAVTSPPPAARTVTIPMGATPVKITLTSTPSRTTTTTSCSTTQKVIIVSSSGNSCSPSILQRSLSIPIVKPVSTTTSSSTLSSSRGTSLIISNQSQTAPSVVSTQSSNNNLGNIVTIAASGNGANMTPTTVSIGGIPTTAYITSQAGAAKVRPRATTPVPTKPRPRSGSIFIPVIPSQQQGGQSSQNLQGIQSMQLKTATQPTKQQAIQLKQEGGMKIISQTVPISGVPGTAKILPKPTFTTSTGAPVYVMTTASSNISVVTRTVTAGTGGGPRVVTVSTGTAPRTTATATPFRSTSSAVVTVNPKTLQTIQVAPQTAATIRPNIAKPNVIVVQKSSGIGRGITVTQGGRELVGKVTIGKPVTSVMGTSSGVSVVAPKPSHMATVVQNPGGGSQGNSVTQTLNLPVSASQGNVIVLDLSQEQLSKNTMLTDILQATGILGESPSLGDCESAGGGAQNKTHPNNEWIQMDTDDHPSTHSECGSPVSCSSSIAERTEEKSTTSDFPSQQQGHVSLREVSLPFELAEGQMVTLEEAVEFLGRSDSEEARHLLRQAGIEIRDSGPTTCSEPSTETLPSCGQVQASSVTPTSTQSTPLQVSSQGTMEMIGELDPQTGIFYPLQTPSSEENDSSISKQESSPEVKTSCPSSSAVVASGSSMDIFSTALATADINLDPFHYIEDDISQLHGDGNSSHQSNQSSSTSASGSLMTLPSVTQITSSLITSQPVGSSELMTSRSISNMEGNVSHLISSGKIIMSRSTTSADQKGKGFISISEVSKQATTTSQAVMVPVKTPPSVSATEYKRQSDTLEEISAFLDTSCKMGTEASVSDIVEEDTTIVSLEDSSCMLDKEPKSITLQNTEV